MYQSFTVEIGKSGNQNFPIKCKFVSGKHCTITYNPQYNNFTVVDHSSNGTWIIDDSQGLGNLQFHRIAPHTPVHVSLGTWLNLGGIEPGNGHRMLVDHLLADAEDYSTEFRHYNMKLAQYHEEIEQLEEEQRKKQNMVVWLRSGITLGAVILLYGIFAMMGKKMDGPWVIGCTTLSMTITNFINPNKSRELKTLRKNVGKYFICPRCGHPLNEFAINSMQCQCGAH